MERPALSSLTRTPITVDDCEGAGEPAEGVEYGTAICPVCKGIAQVSDDDTIEAHTVRVI